MDARRYLTEFDGPDGHRYAGPIVLADCWQAAEAIIASCLLGPAGQPITCIGELVLQTDVLGLPDVQAHVLRPS